MEKLLHHYIGTYNDYVGTYLLMALLIPTGIYLTLRTRFVQLFRLRHSVDLIRGLFDSKDDPGDINHFQALCAALSATVGTGNIVGVSLAIYYGGPGALFWMWLTGFFGMATKFVECTLAQAYRVIHEDGSASGGPMYYIEHGLKDRFGRFAKVLAGIFAIGGVICALGTGNMAQTNSLTQSLVQVATRLYGAALPTWFVYVPAVFVSFLIGLVILGGIKRIAHVSEKLVPTMAAFYVLAALVVILANLKPYVVAIVIGGNLLAIGWTFTVTKGRGRRFALVTVTWMVAAVLSSYALGGRLFGVLKLIVTSAFTGHAAVGGFAGAVFLRTARMGICRGLFSNEAGQGSAPMAHAAAKTEHPIREGFVAMTGPLIDTLIICTMTGLVIIFSGCWTGGMKGVAMTTCSFEQGLGAVSQNLAFLGFYVVSMGQFMFAISTAFSWCYYGERCLEYLTGEWAIQPFRYLYCVFAFLGAIFGIELVWAFCDMAMTWMAIPNLIAIIFLVPIVLARLEKYREPEHPALETA